MEGRYAVVDIETSGLKPHRHRILQVALVTVADGKIVDEWVSLVRLRWWQRVGPRRVHGISRSTLRGAPELADVLADFARRLDGATFVAHNVKFDWAFLERSARRARIALPDAPKVDTLWLSRQLDPDRQLFHGLAAVAERYGITNERPHDALHDARTTAQILPHLLAATSPPGG
ncbi:MAG TPA: 3'-5' exonuclease [Ilumatobacter sp.]|nr:3'-5' exonuclease [Ilumatobacter sp.]